MLTLIDTQTTCQENGSGRPWLRLALIGSMLMICTTLRGFRGYELESARNWSQWEGRVEQVNYV